MARRIEQYLIDKAFERLDDVHCALHTRLPEIRRALFVEDNDREVSTSGPVTGRLVARDVASAREFLREVLGSVTVYAVKHQANPQHRLYSPGDRLRIDWPNENGREPATPTRGGIYVPCRPVVANARAVNFQAR
jgi:hypothetical protein